IRNSKIVDIYRELQAFGIEPMVHDPVADPKTVEKAYGVELCDLDQLTDLSALIVAVAHDQFSALDGERLNAMLAPDGVLVDIRSRIDPASLRPDLCYWSL
ncbi:MAG TPA: UDP binding domain-containing protein, partial [Sphingomicrobium sp.]|nr:UDP binding domain-containing protein [Sphingomicrobium sp.]